MERSNNSGYQECRGCEKWHQIRGGRVYQFNQIVTYDRFKLYVSETGRRLGENLNDYACTKFMASILTFWKKHVQSCRDVTCICGGKAGNQRAILRRIETDSEVAGTSTRIVTRSGREIRPTAVTRSRENRRCRMGTSRIEAEREASSRVPLAEEVENNREIESTDANVEPHMLGDPEAPLDLNSVEEETTLDEWDELAMLRQQLQIEDFEEFESEAYDPNLLTIEFENEVNLIDEHQGAAMLSQTTDTQDSMDILLSAPTSSRVKLSDIKTAPFSHSHCVVCGKDNSVGRSLIPLCVRKELWFEKQIYIKKGTRCCAIHISEEMMLDDAKSVLEAKAKKELVVNTTEIKEWISWLTNDFIKLRRSVGKFNLDDEKVSDETYITLTGFDKNQFNEILSCIEDHLHQSKNRSKRTALGVFLAKLRLGVSQKVLSVMFGIKDQITVSKMIQRVADLLNSHFVPLHLGFAAYDRTRLIRDHQPKFVRRMFNLSEESVLLTADGTYFYIQQSSDFELQRSTYSPHKHRNLTKFMMIVSPDGTIVDCIGPIASDNLHTDANIFTSMLKDENSSLANFLKPGDHFVLDRGFRDSTRDLDQISVSWSMPPFLDKSQKKFTADEANQGRKVTMTRWPVEVQNGQLKNRFHFLENVIPILYLEKMEWFVRIACALINRFGKPFERDVVRLEKIAEQVEQRIDLRNLLEEKVNELISINIRSWQLETAETVIGFPRLTEGDILDITLGYYQIRMGKRYNKRHMIGCPMYEVLFYQHSETLIQVQLQSRFRRSIKHRVFIEFSKDETRSSVARILGYMCRCEQGSRVVGCCSHVAAVLLHLGHDMHEPELVAKSRVGTWNLINFAEKITRDELEEEDEEEEQENRAPQKRRPKQRKETASEPPALEAEKPSSSKSKRVRFALNVAATNKASSSSTLQDLPPVDGPF